MARETSLWNWLKKARMTFKYDLHMNRVENSTMKGMPDVEGHLTWGNQFWIELKSAARPAKPSTLIRFKVKDREAQVEWLRRRRLVGGYAWLLLQVGSGGDRKLYLIPGEDAAEVYEGVKEMRLRQLTKLPEAYTPSDVVRRAARGPANSL